MTQTRRLYLEWMEQGGRVCLRVRGWAESELRELGSLSAADLRWRLAILPSTVLEEAGNFREVPPVAGQFSVDFDSVCFVPRFPFIDGTVYSFLVDAGGGPDSPEVWTLQRPLFPSAPAMEVVKIYPSAAEVPVNLLKVYIHFSGPMSEGWADHAVKVCREDTGEALEGAFLPPDPELWDPARRRLTMLLDPGRIKRGLVPNLEAGYPLIEGTPVRVQIGPEYRDARGQPLKTGGKRTYRIGPALRSRIDPGRWRLTAPGVGSRRPLLVEFDRPLDHALLQHSLRVCGPEGTPLHGRGEVGAAESSWTFTPASPWKDGEYRLVVNSKLEDLSGNTAVRVFDRDVTMAGEAPSESGPIVVAFSCRPSTAF